MTNEDHNKYVSWAFIGYGAFQTLLMLIIALFFVFFMNVSGAVPGRPGPPLGMMVLFFAVMFVMQAVFTILTFVAAYGIKKRRPWARVASIIAAVLAAINVPFGTATGIYALWFFMGDEWKPVYAAPESRTQISWGEAQDPRWTGQETTPDGEIHFHAVEPPDWR